MSKSTVLTSRTRDLSGGVTTILMLSLEPTRTAQSRRKTGVSLLPPYLCLYAFSARPRSHKGSVVISRRPSLTVHRTPSYNYALFMCKIFHSKSASPIGFLLSAAKFSHGQRSKCADLPGNYTIFILVYRPDAKISSSNCPASYPFQAKSTSN